MTGKDKGVIGGIVFGLLGVVFLLNCFTVVTAESEGAVTSFGEVKSEKRLVGFNMVWPWWSIDEYNNLLTTLTLEDKGIPSQDKFKTQMDISYTGRFKKGYADKIRASTGTASQFLATHVEKKVRSCTIGAGTQVKNSQAFFEEKTQGEMTNYVLDCVNAYLQEEEVGGGYELTQVQFTEIELDPVVRKFMVTTKQRQEEEEQQESALRIADLKSQEITKISNSKMLASVDNKTAAGNVSDAKRYDIEQVAIGNTKLNKSITPDLIRYLEAQRWDGKRSTVVAGQGTELLIDTRGK